MTIATLRHKWLLAMSAVVCFLAYLGYSGTIQDQRRDLDLQVLVNAQIKSPGICIREMKRSSGRGSSGWIYIPTVNYEYEFAGKKYDNNQIYRSSQFGFNTQPKCNEFLKEFGDKDKVTAWIDPKEPSFSVLNASKGSWFLESLFLSLGLIMLFSFLLLNRKVNL